MDLSLEFESSMAKGIWRVLKVVLMVFLKRFKIELRNLIRGIIATIKEGKLARSSAKVFQIYDTLSCYEFSCKTDPNLMDRFELAKNCRPFLPSISLPTVTADFMENECYPGENAEMGISVMGTPPFISVDSLSPLLSPCSLSYANFCPDSEVDQKAEEFIRWFRNQYLKL
ncbi:hypothetical protein MLD38_000086 [Melastoma candidum]|uniref:Uncharacterized protein n=1 Tax=Melastoma candidum TaxID=119954 RepID=A0ACB9SAY2_9MYRT|nr:hypothetical protein MLD38_000086 [Melastoma candidum]